MRAIVFYEVDLQRVVSAVQTGGDLQYAVTASYVKNRYGNGWWVRGVRVGVTYNGVNVGSYELENANDFPKSIQLFEDVLMLRSNGGSHTGLPAGVP